MGKINILNDAGTAKLSLEFTGTSNATVNAQHLSTITSDVQSQLNAKVNKSGDTISGQLIVEGSNGAVTVRGASTGAQLKLERTASSQGHGYLGADATYALRVFNSAFADGLRVDQGGRVTLPYQPMISMRLTSSKGTGLISWDEYMVNQGITYNSTTRRFTVPVTGNYRINFNGFKGAAYGTSRLLIGRNTDSAQGALANNIGHIYSDDVNGYDTFCIDVIVSLAANDYFTFNLVEGGLYSAPNDAFNFMNAHLLG